MSELDQLRQEAEQLKNQIRVSIKKTYECRIKARTMLRKVPGL